MEAIYDGGPHEQPITLTLREPWADDLDSIARMLVGRMPPIARKVLQERGLSFLSVRERKQYVDDLCSAAIAKLWEQLGKLVSKSKNPEHLFGSARRWAKAAMHRCLSEERGAIKNPDRRKREPGDLTHDKQQQIDPLERHSEEYHGEVLRSRRSTGYHEAVSHLVSEVRSRAVDDRQRDAVDAILAGKPLWGSDGAFAIAAGGKDQCFGRKMLRWLGEEIEQASERDDELAASLTIYRRWRPIEKQRKCARC